MIFLFLQCKWVNFRLISRLDFTDGGFQFIYALLSIKWPSDKFQPREYNSVSFSPYPIDLSRGSHDWNYRRDGSAHPPIIENRYEGKRHHWGAWWIFREGKKKELLGMRDINLQYSEHNGTRCCRWGPENFQAIWRLLKNAVWLGGARSSLERKL